MTNKSEGSLKNALRTKLEKSDWCILALVALVFIGISLVYVFTNFAIISQSTATMLTYIYREPIFHTLFFLDIGILISLTIKILSSKIESVYWGFFSILSFSMFGSVIVTAFTNIDGRSILIAIGFSLAHIGYWTWKREYKARETFNVSLNASVGTMHKNVTTVKRILDIMPNSRAFEISLRGYGNVRPILASQYQFLLPHLVAGESLENKDIQIIKDQIESGLKEILSTLCSIGVAWTKKHVQHFESNIMILKSPNEITSDEENKEVFRNSACFFVPSCSFENIATIYQACLSVETELAYHTNNPDYTASKKLLPVGHIEKRYIKISIPGAPEACEKNKATCVANTANIAKDIQVFSSDQKRIIQEQITEQGDFKSIVSFPLPVPNMLYKHLGIKKSIHEKFGCVGAINLYSEKKGGVKDADLMYNLCAPLLYIAADLLLFRKSLKTMM